MYNMKPLIEMFYNDCRIEQENHVMKAVADLGIVIDKPRLIKAINDARSFYSEGYAAAEKSLVRHGQWIEAVRWIRTDGHKKSLRWMRCSNCGFRAKPKFANNYCPNCGTKMDGENP